MEEELRALLLADATLSAIVGSRIDWGARPQGRDLPAIALHKISGSEWIHMNGPNGVFQARVQVDAYAKTDRAATEIARALNAALNCYRGGGFRFIEQLNDSARMEGGGNGAGRPFRASIDFQTTWRAS